MVGRRARPLLRTAYPGRVGDSTAPAGGRWRRRAWPRPAPRDPPAPADPGNPQEPPDPRNPQEPPDPGNPQESGNPPERGPDDRPGRIPRRRRPPSRTPIRRRSSLPPAAVARDGPARSARPHRRGRAPAIRRIRFHVKPKRSASVPAWKGSSLDRRTYRNPAPCHPCPLRMGRHRQRSRPRYRTTRAGRQQSAGPDRPSAASWPTLSTRGQPTADGRARLRMCVTCAPSIPGAGWTNRRETHREHRERHTSLGPADLTRPGWRGRTTQILGRARRPRGGPAVRRGRLDGGPSTSHLQRRRDLPRRARPSEVDL